MTREKFWKEVTVRSFDKFRVFLNDHDAVSNGELVCEKYLKR